MEETCGSREPSNCVDVIKDEQVNENVMPPLLAADNSTSTSCDTSDTGTAQEKLNKDYCMEATKLILDLGN